MSWTRRGSEAGSDVDVRMNQTKVDKMSDKFAQPSS